MHADTFPFTSFDPVPHPRNKWQVVRGSRVFGRWRHEEGKAVGFFWMSAYKKFFPHGFLQVFVLGPESPHSTHLKQQMDVVSFVKLSD